MTQPDDTLPPTSAGEIPPAESAAAAPEAAAPVDTGQVDAAPGDAAMVDAAQVDPAAAPDSAAPDTATTETPAVDTAEHVDGELVHAEAAGHDEPAAASADPDADAVEAELVPPAPPPAVTFSTTTHAPSFDYTDAGVPTLGYLQDKIERRYGTALGATELAAQDERAKAAAKKVEDREQAAADKLAEIRRSLHPEG